MWVRAKVSRDDEVSFKSGFFELGDWSGIPLEVVLDAIGCVGSGEQLSTARSLCGFVGSLGPKGGTGGIRDAESD